MRCPNGRGVTIPLQNLVSRPQQNAADEEPDCPLTSVNDKEVSSHDYDLPIEQDGVDLQRVEDHESRAQPNLVPRRSSRINKGVSPLHYGVDQE